MNVYLSHRTALEYWRRHPAPSAYRTIVRGGIGDFTARARDIAGLCLDSWAAPPFDVLVPLEAQRRHSSLVSSHVCSHPLPDGSFAKVKRGVAVSVPELCFAQLAARLSLPRLVLLGYELCGSYVLRPGDPNGFIGCDPLTSVDRLRSYLDRLRGFCGDAKARRALACVADGAASPVEAQIAMLLCMPKGQGGYGLALPRLNHRLVLSDRAARESGRSVCRCGLYWPDARLCVEYNGDTWYTGARRIAGGVVGTNALVNDGVTVVVVTSAQLCDAAKFDEVAHVVARCLGVRLRIKAHEHAACRAMLRGAIFA